MARRIGKLASLVAVALSLAMSAVAQNAENEFDVIVRGGRVLDGTGMPWRLADLGIKGDRIVRVGFIPKEAQAGRIVNAAGKYVTPGFIDAHSHAIPGLSTAALAGAVPILYQGITTVLINPDGGGPADLAPLLAAIEKHTPGVNVIPTIGHNGVRSAVMGRDDRAPTPAELQKMKDFVRKAMDEGAFGFSSGPFYIPGKYSKTDELVELAKIAAAYPGAFHTSHIRDEASYDVGVINAVKELIEVSRQARLPGIVTHIKTLGPSVWGKSKDVIEVINAARAEGLEIWADQYAYAASGSGLQPSLVPGWAQAGGQEAMAKRLKDPEQRAEIRKEMISNMERRGGANSMLIRSFPPEPALQGKRLDEIARMKLQDPVDTAIDMLIQGGASIVSFNMNEKDVEAFMRQPWVMTCTDGGLSQFGSGEEHPRAYGAFPRKIRRYVLERGVIKLEQAIHSSTGLTATVLGVKDRGFLREGAYADVVVFDPGKIRDAATYEEPDAYSEGVDYLLVNGKFAVDGGKALVDRHGRVLRRGR
jgi:N-acyl-D-aspartate/D-glutamate deacylase